MTRELEYLEEALDEAEAAARWYAERSVTAAAAFSSEIDAAEAAILRLPLSHSNHDWLAVRQIRNLLEAHGHRPLMFFLKCLNDHAELHDLIRREIEARTWFLLCDSQAARQSRWVREEMELIRSLPALGR